jgi:prepilin-type N-terminal cleavage/methylation domain-containing protein
MAQKYTILKAITRTSNKGFTLLELLIGMIITLIIGGLAMQAFINASATFSKDKKTIESDQNLSAVLDIIGNDIKQSGENIGISDSTFPTIEFGIDPASTATPPSSKLTIRRALSDSLTLCESIAANATLPTSLVVADNTPATVTASATCDVGTVTSQLLGSRPSTNYTFPIPSSPAPSIFPAISGKSQLFPSALRKARDYRCQLDNPNPTTAYDDASQATVDFCGGSTLETVRVAISDLKGHILIFNQTDETSGTPTYTNPVDTDPATSVRKYSITLNTTGIPTATNTRNIAVAYPIGSPIYLFEERVYTLDNDTKNLKVSINGAPASTLVKKIDKFTVSARIYSDNVTKAIAATPADSCNSTTNTQFSTNALYTCKFNASTTTAATASDPTYNWKNLAGVKIELQAQYDGTGQNATPTQADRDKLTATAEYFPRNVMSK